MAEVLRAKNPPGALWYEDSPEFFRLTYPLMQCVANAVAARNNLDLAGPDPMLLPTAPAIAKYLRPAVSTLRTTPKGVELTVRQSLPSGNLGATLWVVGCSMLPADAKQWMEDPSAAPTAAPPSVAATPAPGPRLHVPHPAFRAPHALLRKAPTWGPTRERPAADGTYGYAAG